MQLITERSIKGDYEISSIFKKVHVMENADMWVVFSGGGGGYGDVLERAPEAVMDDLVDLGFDGIVAAGIDLNIWNKMRGGHSCVLGQAIPSRLFTPALKDLQAYLEAYLPPGNEPGVFLTTDWEVPPDTPPENIRFIMETISKG